jgi:hypothetical protein
MQPKNNVHVLYSAPAGEQIERGVAHPLPAEEIARYRRTCDLYAVVDNGAAPRAPAGCSERPAWSERMRTASDMQKEARAKQLEDTKRIAGALKDGRLPGRDPHTWKRW